VKPFPKTVVEPSGHLEGLDSRYCLKDLETCSRAGAGVRVVIAWKVFLVVPISCLTPLPEFLMVFCITSARDRAFARGKGEGGGRHVDHDSWTLLRQHSEERIALPKPRMTRPCGRR
jgi:hypothetical protein